MTAGYTPTTYQIRLGYRAAWGPTNVATRLEVDGIADGAFDRGMAAHDAEVAAKALLDAADVIQRRDNAPLVTALLEMECNSSAKLATEWCEGLLRDRADALGDQS